MATINGNTTAALLNSQLRVSNAANNIANAGTPNFKPQDVVQYSDAGSVQAELVDRDSVTIDGLPDVDFAQELVTAQLATYDFKANAKLLKTQQELQKRLIDIVA